ncbi:flagellar basal body P-ring protein FlgI [Klebsiella pneumoniae]|uniref:flagellar basal body P-ring protein FlgI n=1 Tax=Klebsiella pneumoniae TaxID=573 RepID=UPI003D34630C
MWQRHRVRCADIRNARTKWQQFEVRFAADIQNQYQVNVTPQDAKVVINSRTGSVVMNREVTLDSCAVAQGKSHQLQSIVRPMSASQATPFGGGQTVATPQTQIDLRQERRFAAKRTFQRQPQ